MCADAVDLGHQVLHGELFLGDEEDFVLGEKTKNKNQLKGKWQASRLCNTHWHSVCHQPTVYLLCVMFFNGI